ncbi:MAG: NAD(P)/FAD-dependent oxidoreductase [Epulopiscium sp.]|jgi:nitrite reductase (NADH) large subunit|nr:NAD(P)/FAD-dependent oxidoreductase [Candidatus Epulonipiscium sp.]
MSNDYLASSRNILIVGNGTAGLSAAKAARTQDPEAKIIMFGEDERLPYYRLRLCDYIGNNESCDKLVISNEEWFEKNKIQLELSSKVTSIDVKDKKISTDDKEYSYDSLILATGSTPIMPNFKGKDLLGIHTIWTWEDIVKINKSLLDTKRAVVIGGGLLGLEAAYKISEMGIDVSLIESMPRLLPKQLDEEGSEIFREKVQSLGISVLCGKYVTGFGGDDKGHVRQVHMADNTLLEADVVIVTVGVAPNISLVQNSGISMDRFLNVNERMETSIKDIYAVGDIACINGKWFGQWSVAGKQGQVSGINAAGGDAIYKIDEVPYILATMGTRVVCSGDIAITQSDNIETTYLIEQKKGKEKFNYSRLVFSDGLFVGYILVGEPAKAFNKLQSLLKTSANIETINSIIYS